MGELPREFFEAGHSLRGFSHRPASATLFFLGVLHTAPEQREGAVTVNGTRSEHASLAKADASTFSFRAIFSFEMKC